MPADSVTALVADALRLAPDAITGEEKLGETERWDSLAHMRLIAAIEEKLARSLDAETILTLTTYEAVKKVLENSD